MDRSNSGYLPNDMSQHSNSAFTGSPGDALERLYRYRAANPWAITGNTAQSPPTTFPSPRLASPYATPQHAMASYPGSPLPPPQFSAAWYPPSQFASSQYSSQYPSSQYPVLQSPVSQRPVSQSPALQHPFSQNSLSLRPVSHHPAPQQPVSQQPFSHQQAPQQTVSQQPVSPQPVSQYPATQRLLQKPRSPASPSIQPAPAQHYQRQDGITREMITTRIYQLLEDNTQGGNQLNVSIQKLAQHFSRIVINLGKASRFGPLGLASVSDICVFVGHQGTRDYMCLAVNSRNGNVITLLEGQKVEGEGKNALEDEKLMAKIRAGFDESLSSSYSAK